MKKILDSLEGGSAKRQKKTKFTVTLIYATIILIVCLLAVLLITTIVAKVKENNTGDTEGDGGGANAGYTALNVDTTDIHSGNLLLVNKNTEYIFENKNAAVVSFPTTNRIYGLKNSSLKVNPTALSAFNEMMTALYTAVPDANIVVMTAYRSADEQTALGTSTAAGYSDFHTGMLLELKDGDTWAGIDDSSLNGKYDWIYENAHKYGFVARYPADIAASDTGNNAGKSYSSITGVEDFAYAFRYVGIAHATYMYQNELCLEEYLELIRTSHAYGSALTIKGGDGKSYEVYYFASAGETTEIMVPSKYSYEISGDNMNGYIVTVNKSKTVK
ncbi:MAG: D-alanyl-D-alanine carboxypeptidase family protein [Clostridia bacterium]|nr:D-alanyl-D-alanine carboxypeptidase family protein [Clostridia bacterium]